MKTLLLSPSAKLMPPSTILLRCLPARSRMTSSLMQMKAETMPPRSLLRPERDGHGSP